MNSLMTATRTKAKAQDTKRARGSGPRDPERTSASILAAAVTEFTAKGYAGARIDAIALRSGANKRMIYHYFGGKEDLFTAVLEEAYLDIRAAERKLDLDKMEPEEAIDALVEFTWRYYLKNPEFLTLVNSENLHKGRHLRSSKVIQKEYPRFLELVQGIIDRGVAKGVFRDGISAVQLNITIAAISYYYLTNRYTGSIIYDRDLMDSRRLEERLEFNLQNIRRLLYTCC